MPHLKPPITSELFHTLAAAEEAYQYALSQGYKPDEINIIMSEETQKKYSDHLLEDSTITTAKEVTISGATGLTIGGLIGVIAAIGTNFVVPGLGLIIAGPLAGAGAIAGGLVGSLVGLGVSKENAAEIDEGINKGGILLCVDEAQKGTDLKEKWKEFKQV